ncbi:MAG: hypothetical protein ABSD80_03395 [Caulobacteraceae bacterium]
MISKRGFLSGTLAGAIVTPLIGEAENRGAVRRSAGIGGCKSLAAVGSIAKGSDRLRLRSNPGFQVGDYICVETGGEANGGAPGAMGVGGAWPALNFATTAALLADTRQPNAAFAWARDSGDVYQWYDGAWKPTRASGNWLYWWKCIPRALLARVTGVAGNVLVLDTAAAAAANNAGVYFNNSYPLNALIKAKGDNHRYVFPAGTFWFAGTRDVGANSRAVLQVTGAPGVEIAGAGQDVTVFRSPKGACSFEGAFFQSPNGHVHDLTFYGNFFLTKGWGFNYQYTETEGVDQQPPGIPIAVLADEGSHGLLVSNVTFRYCSRSIASKYADHCVAHRCAIHTDGNLSYLQWQLYWTNCSDCWSYDCSVTSSHLTTGIGCFAANDCGHINPTMVNATVALNSTGGCTIASPRVRITALSQLSANSFSAHDPIFDINQNIPQNRGRAGNRVLNMNVVQEGYINANRDVLIGFNVSGGGRDSHCIGGRFSAPDYAGNGGRGPQAANSDSGENNTMVSGLTCIGAPNPHWGNINIVNGSVSKCVAPLIVCAGPTCALT